MVCFLPWYLPLGSGDRVGVLAKVFVVRKVYFLFLLWLRAIVFCFAPLGYSTLLGLQLPCPWCLAWVLVELGCVHWGLEIRGTVDFSATGSRCVVMQRRVWHFRLYVVRCRWCIFVSCRRYCCQRLAPIVVLAFCHGCFRQAVCYRWTVLLSLQSACRHLGAMSWLVIPFYLL